FFHHLVEEGHQLVGELRRHPRDLVHVLTLQIEDVLQRLVARLRQYVHQLDRQALQLTQRDLGRGLLLGGERREQRPLAAAREPLRPTQAPTGSIESSREETAILVRLPASRAVARISTIPCWISGTSSLNSAFTNRGSARDRMRRGPLGVSSIRFNTARIVSPWWKCSRWFCSR